MNIKPVNNSSIECDCCYTNMSTCKLMFNSLSDMVFMCDPCYLRMKEMFKNRPD